MIQLSNIFIGVLMGDVSSERQGRRAFRVGEAHRGQE